MLNFENESGCIQIAYFLDVDFGEHYSSVRKINDNFKKPAQLVNTIAIIEGYKEIFRKDLEE